MVIMMNDSKLNSINQIKSFLSETEAVEFKKKSKKEAYCWIEETLSRFHYVILSKKEKGLIRRYLMKITGYSRAQLTRQIAQYRKTGQVRIKEYDRHRFEKKYTSKDIQLLAHTAQLHDSPNGAALKKNLERMAREYGKAEYANVSHISVSHIYNLLSEDQKRQRENNGYKMQTPTRRKTRLPQGGYHTPGRPGRTKKSVSYQHGR